MNKSSHSRILLGQQASPDRLETGEECIPFDVPNAGHLMTIAPTGSDRMRASIIPTLFRYPGSVVVLDPAGRSWSGTGEARRTFGRVLLIDPFSVAGDRTDALNPLELLSLERSDVGMDSNMIARLLMDDGLPASPGAMALLTGVIEYITAVPEKQTIPRTLETFVADDVVYNLAVVLDTIGKQIPRSAYQKISGFLQLQDVNRSQILSEIQDRVITPSLFTSHQAARTLEEPSLAMKDVISGEPVSIYIIMPPHSKLGHSRLFRLWIGALLQGLIGTPGAQKFLFLLDGCATLGHLPLFANVAPALRDTEPCIWSFWDDMSQLRALYPLTWETMLGRATAIQLLGNDDYAATAESSTFLGLDPADAFSLPTTQQVLRRGCKTIIAKTLAALGEPTLPGTSA